MIDALVFSYRMVTGRATMRTDRLCPMCGQDYEWLYIDPHDGPDYRCQLCDERWAHLVWGE